MARKNRRTDSHDPLPESVADLGVARPRAEPGKTVRLETRAERNERVGAEFRRQRNRQWERDDAKIAQAVDWETCCIPGCSEPLRPAWLRAQPQSVEYVARDQDVSKKLPICTRHEVIVSNQAAPHIAHADYMHVRLRLARQYVERNLEEAKQFDVVDESNGAKQGQIYFVRLNGMVKVGWSLRLRTRLKAYGASAEVLCHYPASRADETLMHRQLRPFLARGREWYQDCPLVADVVAGIVARHGSPTIEPYWTEPKRPMDAKPRGWPKSA